METRKLLLMSKTFINHNLMELITEKTFMSSTHNVKL